mgnify:CR=1 FL=1
MTGQSSTYLAHPPLVTCQENAVNALAELWLTHEYHVRPLVLLLCPKCKRRPVGGLSKVLDGPERPWRSGRILTGTQPWDPEFIQWSAAHFDQVLPRRPRLPATYTYSAFIDLPGLPSVLPFWCDHHQALSLSVRDLRAVAAQVEAQDLPMKRIRIHRVP